MRWRSCKFSELEGALFFCFAVRRMGHCVVFCSWGGGQKRRQTACKPGSVRSLRTWTAIPLGRDSRRASRDQPGRRGGNAPASHQADFSVGAAGHPYSVLLPVGFTLPPPLPGARCALAAPFHPCPQAPKGVRAVCFLWHCPWGRPRRPLAGTVFPWSPDFPPPPEGQRPSSRLAQG